jgi:hypothetical protein
MQAHTLKAWESLLKADETVTTAERNKMIRLALGESAPAAAQAVNEHEPRIYSRAEAAKLLGGKSPRYIDLLSKRGLLKKFTPKGNKRAIGVFGESLHAFISGN